MEGSLDCLTGFGGLGRISPVSIIRLFVDAFDKIIFVEIGNHNF